MRLRPWIVCLLIVIFAAGCQSNNCQDLCTYYYQMELRCNLFGQDSGQKDTSCVAEADDPQLLKQRTDYNIRQCRLDFRYPTCQEQTTCCKASCFQSLVNDYDAVTRTDEASVDTQRDLCQKYHALVKTGEAPWCTALQTTCKAAQAGCTD